MGKIALSWSGGKDSCYVLDTLIKQGKEVACLVTTVPKEIGRTFGHGEREEMIIMQGEALGIPIEFISCSLEHYTEDFIASMEKLKAKYGLTGIAFGDLYLDEHRDWGERAAAAAGLDSLYPHWMKQQEALEGLKRFIQTGYKAVIIRVREDVLTENWLGRELDFSFYEDIQREDVCPLGESGEYHTFVYAGPLFKRGIQLGEKQVISYETTKKLEYAAAALSE